MSSNREEVRAEDELKAVAGASLAGVTHHVIQMTLAIGSEYQQPQLHPWQSAAEAAATLHWPALCWHTGGVTPYLEQVLGPMNVHT